MTRVTFAEDPEEAAQGALLGALLGDACGATLEFLGRPPTAPEVEAAMGLPGGGFWRLAPGQITDDGELTLTLARELAEADVYDSSKIAEAYRGWLRSDPFDCGRTIRRAFSGETPDRRSEANGSLMRCVPLGLWACRLGDDELAALAFADSDLSHPNANVRAAVAAYCLALAELVVRPGADAPERAFERAFAWARRRSDDVADWLDLSREGLGPPFHPKAGHVKIAFTHAFRQLLSAASFEDALREVLTGGGDTDTNACVAGGLVGAARGRGALPADLVNTLLACRTEEGRPRPTALHPRAAPELARRLLGRSPRGALPRLPWLRRLFGL